MTGSVSVVVCAHNEERHLQRLLESLAHQTLTPEEVIVVDDGSTDATAEIAERAGASTVRLRHRGPALGRNVGVQHASGEAIVFADGDMELGRKYVERLASPILDGQHVGTFTADLFFGEPANAWARAYGVIRRLGYPRLLPADFPERWENFRAVDRRSFLAVGGYDDVGYGEDMTLAAKLGTTAVRVRGAECWHYGPDGPREIFANARWIGRGHDVRNVAHPVRDNLPTAALRRSPSDLRYGAPAVVATARQIYSFGFLLGLAERRWRPSQHAR